MLGRGPCRRIIWFHVAMVAIFIGYPLGVSSIRAEARDGDALVRAATSGQDQAAKVFESAEQALERISSSPQQGSSERGELLSQERVSLATARRMHEASNQPAANHFSRVLAAGKEATIAQGGQFVLQQPVVATGQDVDPSHAARALLSRHSVTANSKQAEQLTALDALGAEQKTGLTRFFSAYLAFEDAAEAVFGKRPYSSHAPMAASTADETNPDLGRILDARTTLLDSTGQLAGAFGTSQSFAPVEIQIPPVLAIDLQGTNSVYRDDFVLQLDVAGNDTYLNNAGGNGVGTTSVPETASCSAGGGAAALVDLDGDDKYVSPVRWCGLNGGARNGAGFLVDKAGSDVYAVGNGSHASAFAKGARGINGGAEVGAGFLLDAEGDDDYRAGRQGTNGGVSQGGVGSLIDGGGRDNYLAGPGGTNGGGSGGSGVLFDLGGDDTYTARPDQFTSGVNGANGGASVGSGLLLDVGGNDLYEAGNDGANGGAVGGTGLLLDLTGNDGYQGGSTATNGGGQEGLGMLVDGGGGDTYLDPLIPNGNCEDCTIVPKGTVGAQVDSGADEPTEGRSAIRISDVSVTEGPQGAKESASFQVQLDGPTRSSVTVDFSTADGTAQVSDGDYDANFGSAVFEAGESSKTIEVTVNGDNRVEPDETFAVNLTNASENAVIIDNHGEGTIVEDDRPPQEPPTDGPLPRFSVDDVSLMEGDSGTADAVFTITLTGPHRGTAAVDYDTFDGSATRSGADFQTVSGTLLFPPGVNQRQVGVPVIGDTKAEADESFTINLTNPKNAELERRLVGGQGGDGVGKGTIINDDEPPAGGPPSPTDGAAPVFEELGAVSQEGLGGVFLTGINADHHATYGQFNAAGAQNIIKRAIGFVTRQKPAPRLLLVNVPDNPDSISALGLAASGYPPCPDGDIGPVRPGNCFDIAVEDPRRQGVRNLTTVDFGAYDAVVAASDFGIGPQEKRVLRLRMKSLIDYINNGGGLVGLAQTDEEAYSYLCGTKSANAFQPEFGYRVTPIGTAMGLTEADVNGNAAEVLFTEANGFDVAVVDADGRMNSLATRKKLSCDSFPDPTEIAISAGSVVEGDEGLSLLPVTVRLNRASSHAESVDYTVTDKTATAGSDYVSNSSPGTQAGKSTLVFNPGETEKVVNVQVVGDTVVEGEESFFVTLSNASTALITVANTEATIIDDDQIGGGQLQNTSEAFGPSSRNETGLIPRAQAGPTQNQTGPANQGQPAPTRPLLQGQAQPQQQGQQQGVQQANSQAQASTSAATQAAAQVQGAHAMERERQTQVEVAKNGGSNSEGYLATASEGISNERSGALFAAIAATMSFAFGVQKTTRSDRLGVRVTIVPFRERSRQISGDPYLAAKRLTGGDLRPRRNHRRR